MHKFAVCGVLSAVFLCACSGEPKQKLSGPFAELREAHSGINSVEVFPQAEGKQKALVTYSSESVWSAGSWINAISFAQEDMLKRLTKTHGKDFSSVEFIYLVPMNDQYGNTKQEPGLRMEYSMADLLKVNWENATPFMLLDLGTPHFMPGGRAGQLEYCGDNAQFAPIFCGQ